RSQWSRGAFPNLEDRMKDDAVKMRLVRSEPAFDICAMEFADSALVTRGDFRAGKGLARQPATNLGRLRRHLHPDAPCKSDANAHARRVRNARLRGGGHIGVSVEMTRQKLIVLLSTLAMLLAGCSAPHAGGKVSGSSSTAVSATQRLADRGDANA